MYVAPHVVSCCQGLPFAVAGVGDLIALFRCISCRYNFSTTTNAPDLLGAPGRVFATGEVCAGVAARTLQRPSSSMS